MHSSRRSAVSQVRCLLTGLTAAVVVMCLSAPALARVVTLNAAADLGLYSGNPNENRGAGGRMDVGPSQDTLVKFNMLGVLGVGEQITGASLTLYNVRGGYTFSLDVVAYPMIVSWQEGTGTSGGVGGTAGGPWGPVNIGDSVYNYQSVTAVSADAVPVATAGNAWGAAGARGIGTDVANQLMVSQTWTKSNAQQPAIGAALPTLDLTTAGLSVLNAWANGSLTNNGMNIWATGTNYAALGTREYATASCAPQLTLTITQVPEPLTLGLLALGVIGAVSRRRA